MGTLKIYDAETDEWVPAGPVGPPGPVGPAGPPGETGPPGGGMIEASWRWVPSVVVPPLAAGKVGLNDDDPLLATEVYLSFTADAPTADYSAVMTKLKYADHLYIQRRDDSETFWRYTVIADPFPDAASNTMTFPVRLQANGVGVEPGGNTPMMVALQFRGAPSFYRHDQADAATQWSITHDLPYPPAVTIVDGSGAQIIADVVYVDDQNVQITFGFPTSGSAYCT